MHSNQVTYVVIHTFLYLKIMITSYAMKHATDSRSKIITRSILEQNQSRKILACNWINSNLIHWKKKSKHFILIWVTVPFFNQRLNSFDFLLSYLFMIHFRIKKSTKVGTWLRYVNNWFCRSMDQRNRIWVILSVLEMYHLYRLHNLCNILWTENPNKNDNAKSYLKGLISFSYNKTCLFFVCFISFVFFYCLLFRIHLLQYLNDIFFFFDN